MLLTLSGRSFIKIQYSSFPLFPVAYPFRIATQLQYYVKRKKCKVNDVIFSSCCETHAINLGNKNVKIGIFTGGTSVGSKNIFTDISRYPTGKHEVNITIHAKGSELRISVLPWTMDIIHVFKRPHSGVDIELGVFIHTKMNSLFRMICFPSQCFLFLHFIFFLNDCNMFSHCSLFNQSPLVGIELNESYNYCYYYYYY